MLIVEKKYADQLIDEEEEEEGNAEPEDEDARYDTEQWQKDFLRMIPMLHSKNPELYNKDTRFFDPADGLDEQAQIKAAFTNAVGEDDDEDDGDSLLSVKKKSKAEQDAEDAAFNEWQKKHAKANAASSAAAAAAAAKAFGGKGKEKVSKKQPKGFEAKNEGEEVLMRFWKEDAQLDDAQTRAVLAVLAFIIQNAVRFDVEPEN